MKIKAIFLDFYGTLVHEDDDIIPLICQEIQDSSPEACDIREIGKHWWKEFSDMFRNSYGETFKSQRELGMLSLAKTITTFEGECDAEEIIQKQFDHWRMPRIYEDTIPFIHNSSNYELYILSNIDTDDVKEAVRQHGIKVNGIITSEDVRAYKPRPDIFMEALKRFNLSADDVLHIGDSYSSDVCGADAVGIRTIWLNRLNRRKPEGIEPTFTCSNLNEVQDIINAL
ncbi:HAD family hydrolase [Paenibacillus lemnae]|uniref:HAD family hydrolase n=1 Tax=Paenibacillus lemnae TaxID=1330551 RepID=A0A848MFH5_PAELE|nr:HAD family hydrolase [Paenibacillus lemnae]